MIEPKACPVCGDTYADVWDHLSSGRKGCGPALVDDPGDQAQSLVVRFMATMDAAKEAANRSVLDGTISCRVCRALVLESNSEGHYEWHRNEAAADLPRR